jgi:hypothetical protein
MAKIAVTANKEQYFGEMDLEGCKLQNPGVKCVVM